MKLKMLSITSLLVLTLGLGTVLAGCGSGSNEAGGDKTLYILSSAKKIDLDPAKSWNLAITTLGQLERRLTSWDIPEDGSSPKVVADMATDTGQTTDGGKSWTYTLKDGIKYDDGTAVTTADIKWSIERSFAEELSGGIGFHKTLLVGGDEYAGPFGDKELDSIVTPDDKTIVFQLNQKYGDWPWIASTGPFAAVPKGTVDVETYGTNPKATGPFKVENYVDGASLTLTANPNWSSESDTIRSIGATKIVYTLNQDPNVATDRLIADSGDDQSAFASGFVDPAKIAQIQANPDIAKRLVTSKAGSVEYLALNVKSKNLSNLKVRQALQYAVDKSSFRLAKGGEIAGTFATTLITPGIEGRVDYDLYPSDPSGDVEKAKALIKEAGLKPEDITLKFIIDSDVDSAPAEALQASIQRTGIKVELIPQDTESYTENATGDDPDYDIALFSWQPDYPSPNANIEPLYATSQIGGGNYNVSRYSNPKVDKLIVEAQGIVDQKESYAKFAAIDKLILQDSPAVPLIYNQNSWIIGSKLTNFYIGAFPAYPNYLKIGVE
jgi:peptide/nickel transport system substrate-binding protein